MGANPNEQIRNEYASWLATPRRLRVSLSLPANKRAFAEFKGVSERSLYRWEKEPPFQKLVDQRKMQMVGGTPNAAVAAIGGPQPYRDARLARQHEPHVPVAEGDDPVHQVTDDPDEAQYLKVKGTLASMAADGNQGAMDLYLKHWGKSFIEAERSDTNPFADLDDVTLVDRVLRLVGTEYVADWVARQVADGAEL